MCNAHNAVTKWYAEQKRKRRKPKKKNPAIVALFAGFGSYQEYLKSDLWKSIRARVLERDNYKCRLCGKHATQVHHRHYGIRTMKGKTLTHLMSVCGGCHQKIEIDCEGKKRSKSAAEEWLRNQLGKDGAK